MAEALLVKFDFDKYKWQSLPEGYVRNIAGGEYAQDVWNRYLKGDQTLFFGVYVDIASPVSPSQLKEASRDAWIWLRYLIPTIASSVHVDNDLATLHYDPGNASTIDIWADRTLVVTEQKGDKVDLDDLRRRLGPQHVPSSAGDQTWMHIVHIQSDSLSKFGLLLHTHHTPFDGTSLKIIASQYLNRLATILSSNEGVKEPLGWGKEVDSLLPSAFNVLAPIEPVPIPLGSSEEPTFAHPYYASLGSVLQSISESVNNAYGFRPRQADPNWPLTLRREVEFSKEESDLILKSLKVASMTGDKAYTVTHLAHAALAMVVIFDNPPSADAASFFLNNLSLIDCRDRLQEPYSSRHGYPGYALGVNIARLAVSTFQDPSGNVLPLDEHCLLKTLQAVHSIYTAQKSIPGPLSYMAQATEIFCASIKQAVSADKLPPDQCYNFSSDGIGEKYLDRVFTDTSGKTVLIVENFFTSLNRTDPAPFFRISSWNGVMSLSADFNSNIISADDVTVYLTKWKEFMLLIGGIRSD